MRATRVAGIIFGLAFPLTAQTPPKTNPLAGDANALREGAVLFRQYCVPCHGVGAHGGIRGPDLTTGAWSHGGADAELARTIGTGLPGTAMPDNHLTENEVWEIVAYLRTQQKPAAPNTGDARRGEQLFFGSARCATCHIVNGRGGLLGPELSSTGSARSRDYLIESIREPNRQITENHTFGDTSMLNYETVTAVTAAGQSIVGIAMNEDTFTVQLMDAGERIHNLDKKSLKSLKRERRSLMPAYDSKLLSEADLQDVVKYLQSLRAHTPAAEKGASDAH